MPPDWRHSTVSGRDGRPAEDDHHPAVNRAGSGAGKLLEHYRAQQRLECGRRFGRGVICSLVSTMRRNAGSALTMCAAAPVRRSCRRRLERIAQALDHLCAREQHQTGGCETDFHRSTAAADDDTVLRPSRERRCRAANVSGSPNGVTPPIIIPVISPVCSAVANDALRTAAGRRPRGSRRGGRSRSTTQRAGNSRLLPRRDNDGVRGLLRGHPVLRAERGGIGELGSQAMTSCSTRAPSGGHGPGLDGRRVLSEHRVRTTDP